jgi:folate-binding protein YgfZ
MNITHSRTNTKNGLFNLSRLGILKISGSGAGQLLQGQVSCDITTIPSGTGNMGAHCNPQGRIISLFYVARINDEFFLLMPKNIITTAMAALKKYAPFFKAELQDASNSYQVIGAYHHDALAYPLISARINLPSHTNRELILLPPDTISDSEAASHDEWKLLDMLDGIPAIYAETSGTFLPHDINLPELNAVNFNKGCYTGQEIIARMHYRGNPKTHLYRGRSNEPIAPGTLIYDQEKPAGTIIDSSQNVYNHHFALLFTSTAAAIANQPLRTEQGHLIEIQKSE